jgi:hypothetical protein
VAVTLLSLVGLLIRVPGFRPERGSASNDFNESEEPLMTMIYDAGEIMDPN